MALQQADIISSYLRMIGLTLESSTVEYKDAFDLEM